MKRIAVATMSKISSWGKREARRPVESLAIFQLRNGGSYQGGRVEDLGNRKHGIYVEGGANMVSGTNRLCER